MNPRITLVATFVVFATLGFSTANQTLVTEPDTVLKEMSKPFLYFAYGSNMLSKRIHINNPTAVQKYVGILKNHRLDFNIYSKRWRGSVATIVPQPGSDVWGVVWNIDLKDLANLDNQEGVHDNVYFAKNITVSVSTGQKIECRVYQQCNAPEEYVKPSLLPPERQPSFVYLNTIINGANEFHIPNDYVKYLQSFRHNGYTGDVELAAKL